MTPAPTLPPPVTTPPPPTTAGPTTPPWVETPFGLIAGTTPSPYAAFTTTLPPPAPAPAPAPAPSAPATAAFAQVGLRKKPWLPVRSAPVPAAPAAAARGPSWNPLSFLHSTVTGHVQRQEAVEPCQCPCEDMNTAQGVDQAFDRVMT